MGAGRCDVLPLRHALRVIEDREEVMHTTDTCGNLHLHSPLSPSREVDGRARSLATIVVLSANQ